MERKFLIIESVEMKKVQDLLDNGFQIEKMEPLFVYSTSQYSNTVHGKLAIYLIRE